MPGLGRCQYDYCQRDAEVERHTGERLCEHHAILRRAGWRCEAVVPDRLHPGAFRRCTVVGSEIDTYGTQDARCPRHRHV